MRLLYHLLNYSLLFFKEKTINHSIYQSNPFPKPKTYNMENTIIYIVCNPSSGGNKGSYNKHMCICKHMKISILK
jgi:hypothetical protein